MHSTDRSLLQRVVALLAVGLAVSAGSACSDAAVDREDRLGTSRGAAAQPGRYIPPAAVQRAGRAQTGNFGYTKAQRCSGGLLAGTRRLGRFLVNSFKGATRFGGYNCRSIRGPTKQLSMHASGRAVDIFVPLDGGQADNTLGDPIGNYLIENATALGVQYFIWDRTDWLITRGDDSRYGGAHPHHDHLHIELTRSRARNLSSFPATGASGGKYGASILARVDGGRSRVDDGGSRNIVDFLPGERFTGVLRLTNESSVRWPDPRIGYHVGAPYLRAVDYRIESDHPHHDKKSWSLNSANNNPKNPKPSKLGESGSFYMDGMAPGESKRVILDLKASRYSFGYTDHPDLRGWLAHIAKIYGEKRSYHRAPTNVNKFGHPVRDFEETDVFARDQWMFRGKTLDDLEGWRPRPRQDAFELVPGKDYAALHVTGRDSGIKAPKHTAIDTSVYDEMVLAVRSHRGKQTVGVYWADERSHGFSGGRSVRFEAPGDSSFHEIVVPIGHHPKWDGGTVRRLRIDPFENRKPSGGGWWVDLKYVYFQSSGSKRTSSKKSFESKRPVRLKNQCSNERCNGKDDDCDREVDEGVEKRCGNKRGRCSRGKKVCNNGQWSGCRNDRGPTSESCNGTDDDCDGKTDENLRKGCGGDGGCRPGYRVCTNGSWSRCKGESGGGEEVCDGDDNDCDGDVDEGLNCESRCQTGACPGADTGPDAGPPRSDVGRADTASTTSDAGIAGSDAMIDGGRPGGSFAEPPSSGSRPRRATGNRGPEHPDCGGSCRVGSESDPPPVWPLIVAVACGSGRRRRRR